MRRLYRVPRALMTVLVVDVMCGDVSGVADPNGVEQCRESRQISFECVAMEGWTGGSSSRMSFSASFSF